MMADKKRILDRMIKNGYKLEMPYFWYLENYTVDGLIFLEKISWQNKKNMII